MKICKKCNVEKEFECFGKRKQEKDGLYPWCKECVKKQNKKYKKEHKKEISEYNKKWSQEHQEERRKYRQDRKNKRNSHERRRHRDEINYKIACNLRTRLTMAVKGNQKSGSAVRDLGCTITEFKQWKSIDFPKNSQNGKIMSWDNYGRLWHIDHIIPLCLFDLSDPIQFKRAVHYSNLQPMWAEENISKGKY